MNKRLSLVFVLTLSAISAGALPIAAAQQVLTFDPEASQVGFALSATGEDVHGLFHLQSGEIAFDTQSGDASGEIIVQAFGAETGSKKRDKAMHNKVLESDQYPLIVFRPDHVEGELAPSGSSDIQLHGTMVLHGAEHEMTMPATVEIDGDHLTATTGFEVPFVEWGLHDPSFFVLKVAKLVNVKITAEGTLAQATETGPAESR
jgi:polyisoprenoid-binding protein YceI